MLNLKIPVQKGRNGSSVPNQAIDYSYEGAIEKLFDILVDSYDSTNFPDLKATFQFNFDISGKTYQIYLDINQGKAKSIIGTADNPTITIKAPVELWFDFLAERLKPCQLVSSSKPFQIIGNRKLFSIMPNIFKVKIDCSNFKPFIEDYEITEKRKWKKPKKVLVVNGSPQAKNGTTDIYLNFMLEGIKRTGVKIEKLYLAEHKLLPCRGCQACWWETPGKCILEKKDDIHNLYKKWLNSYLTLFAYPVYNDFMPGIVKTLFDRSTQLLHPFYIPYKNTTRKPIRSRKERYSAHFLTCGLPEIKQFNPLLSVIKANCRQMRMPNVATILRPAAWDAIMNPLSREYLIELSNNLIKSGMQLVEEGQVDENISKSISKSYSSSQQYRDFMNKSAFQNTKTYEKS